MNFTLRSGRLTKDMEVRTTADGMAVGRFTLAVDRVKKEGQEQTADFISYVCFGKTAENASKFFTKGTKILVQGRTQTGSYTDKDGKKVYTTDDVVERWEFAESKRDGSTEAPSMPGDWNGVEDSELPFAQPSR